MIGNPDLFPFPWKSVQSLVCSFSFPFPSLFRAPIKTPSLPLAAPIQFLIRLLDTTRMEAAAAAAAGDSRSDHGKMGYGCDHYRRRCKIRAPCCNEVFSCRHCHNDSTSEGDRHEICRQDVERVICLLCDTEQPVAQVCSNCGVNMGEYFCGVCRFYDDDTEKGQYHCDECGICRVGGRDNFFHCQKCGSCYSVVLRDQHSCVENSMRHHCPICYEYLFDSLKETRVLTCGHTIHQECFVDMVKHGQYACPLCSKSILDMSQHWQKLDDEIQATVMPEDYRYKVWIFCNDCNENSEVFFHVAGHKCNSCHSYNTRLTAPPLQPPQ